MKALALVAVLTGVARAGGPAALEVDREAPPAARPEFGFDGGAPLDSWGASLSFGYLDRPLALRSGDVTANPVDHRETVALGAAITLGGRVVAEARMPLAHQVGPRLVAFGDDAALDRWVAGDLELAARARVGGNAATGVFVRGELTLPTGDDNDFAGDQRYSFAWSLIGRATLGGGIVLAATGGIRFRGAEVMIGDRLAGDELTGGLGVSVPVPPIAGLWCEADQLRIAAEVVGVLGDNVANVRGPSPVEARLGVIGRPRPGFVVGVRVGAGLDDQIGAPRFRATLELAWQAPAPPPPPPEPESSETLDE